MEGTIAIEEPRSVVDNFRQWYQEKLIDTGKAAKFEELTEKRVELDKKMVKAAGTIATVALVLCPLDGPFGEIAVILATPALVKLVEAKGEFTKNAVIGTKRDFETIYLGVDGSSKKVVLPDKNIVQNVNDLAAAAEELSQEQEKKK